ncbi:polyhydroxyalkanoate synthesis repressor PhaR [Malikia spinosa]|uniref:Polyhydroxyalkanoate synthesis repressor PhaR n=1 Tax=Malikia spinosa TaxID=86180 RepID=A0A2S9KAD4_9BURK|nr:polyhydroxyalkanoate synthesis repressor PhaR [Malikia spinosa]
MPGIGFKPALSRQWALGSSPWSAHGSAARRGCRWRSGAGFFAAGAANRSEIIVFVLRIKLYPRVGAGRKAHGAGVSAVQNEPDGQASECVEELRVIKKYPNRRLYDTTTSSYITLADVRALVLQGVHFSVRDAKTGADLTRSILLQIILEEETGGVPFFSERMLADIIRFYGHSMQGFMGSYLEQSVEAFADLQRQMADQAKGLTPEMWSQFLGVQSPLIPGVALGGYLEQSQKALNQLQQQMLEAFGVKR